MERANSLVLLALERCPFLTTPLPVPIRALPCAFATAKVRPRRNLNSGRLRCRLPIAAPPAPCARWFNWYGVTEAAVAALLAVRVKIELDGVMVGRLSPGQTLQLDTTAGEHRLRILGWILHSRTRVLHLTNGRRQPSGATPRCPASSSSGNISQSRNGGTSSGVCRCR